MSTDYAEKERDFIDSLEADTGRDLAGWMAAISAQNLAHRNDIIDWLRQQRFTFSNASWLERIHHNGGRPIYATGPDQKAPAVETSEPPRPAREPAAVAPVPAPAAPPPPPVAAAATPMAAAAPPGPAASADIEALLAKGKAYRPLAQHLLRAIEAAVPHVTIGTRGGLVSLTASREFAVLAISPRDVRIGLAMPDASHRDGLELARLPGAGPLITHMAILTDVRRIDTALLASIALAARP